MGEQPLWFGTELRRRRVAAGLSLASLAKLVNYSKSHLSKVETGAKRPSVGLARQCDTVLRCDGRLAALISVPVVGTATAVPGGADALWVMSLAQDGYSDFRVVNNTEVLHSSGFSLLSGEILRWNEHGLVGPAAVASFRSLFDEVRRVGQAVGPMVTMPMLVAQTHALRALGRYAGPDARDRLLVLAGRFAEYTGWMAQEAGDDAAALWWTERAVELATAGGDEELAVYALVRQALVALYRHDAMRTIALAQQAQAASWCQPRIRGLAALREGQGHAIAGHYDECRRALDRADTLLEAAASQPSEDPVIGTSTVPNQVGLVTGWCMHDLGRHDEAADLIEHEFRAIPFEANRVRSRYGARLALAYASSGNIDRACNVADWVLNGVDSATVRVDLQFLARALNRFHSHSLVRQVMARLMQVLHVPSPPASPVGIQRRSSTSS